MKKKLEIHRITRNNIIKAIENLSEEQLNEIPKGFIIWNVAYAFFS